MKLILKDKMIASIKKLVKDCQRIDGFPDHLEVSIQEARWLLLEVHKLNRFHPTAKSLSCISFKKTKTGDENVIVSSPDFFFKHREYPSDQYLKEFINLWYDGRYEVNFKYLDYEFPLLIKFDERKETSNT